MNKIVRSTLDALLYVFMFFLIQYIVTVLVSLADAWMTGISLADRAAEVYHGKIDMTGKFLVASSVLSSILVLIVFHKARWAAFSRTWLATHPWTALVWVVLLALGSMLPSGWLQDQLAFDLPDAMAQALAHIMAEPGGYIAIGILVPIAEEFVFRGAVLRVLLNVFSGRLHWIAIVLSALVFGAVHGNLPQFVHATLIGLLLGWMYYRTDSIFPGIVLHWVNNTVAYVLYNILPGQADAKLIDLFNGNTQTMWSAIAFSLCILLPAVYQLSLRLRKG